MRFKIPARVEPVPFWYFLSSQAHLLYDHLMVDPTDEFSWFDSPDSRFLAALAAAYLGFFDDPEVRWSNGPIRLETREAKLGFLRERLPLAEFYTVETLAVPPAYRALSGDALTAMARHGRPEDRVPAAVWLLLIGWPQSRHSMGHINDETREPWSEAVYDWIEAVFPECDDWEDAPWEDPLLRIRVATQMYQLNGPPPLRLCQNQLDPLPVGWRRITQVIPDDLVTVRGPRGAMEVDRITDP